MPLWIVLTEAREVAYIADVIAATIPINVFVVQFVSQSIVQQIQTLPESSTNSGAHRQGCTPALLQFLETKFVGSVAVDLVVVDRNTKTGVETMLPYGFQDIQSTTAFTSKSSNGRLAAKSWLG